MMPTVPPKQPPMVVEMAQRATTCKTHPHQPVSLYTPITIHDAANMGVQPPTVVLVLQQATCKCVDSCGATNGQCRGWLSAMQSQTGFAPKGNDR